MVGEIETKGIGGILAWNDVLTFSDIVIIDSDKTVTVEGARGVTIDSSGALAGENVLSYSVVDLIVSSGFRFNGFKMWAQALKSPSLLTFLSHIHKPVALKPFSAISIIADLGYSFASNSAA